MVNAIRPVVELVTPFHLGGDHGDQAPLPGAPPTEA